MTKDTWIYELCDCLRDEGVSKETVELVRQTEWVPDDIHVPFTAQKWVKRRAHERARFTAMHLLGNRGKGRVYGLAGAIERIREYGIRKYD